MLLTHVIPLPSFHITLENKGKPDVFCFQGAQEETNDLTRVNKKWRKRDNAYLKLAFGHKLLDKTLLSIFFSIS